MERMRDRGRQNPNLIVWDDDTYAIQFWEARGYRREKTVDYAKEL
jgi:ribosomal protein S18 acetylase RimI-like enzyme